MRYQRLSIPDVILFTPTVFGDERGFFFESFNERIFAEALGSGESGSASNTASSGVNSGLSSDVSSGVSVANFVQDNHSKSSRGVLRGLHYQLPPAAQGKLVRVVQGEVFDVAVDIRRGSATFGQWVGTVLDSDNRQQLWIPPGFAHGFVTLSDTAEFLYKTTDFYSPEHERAIAWNDPTLAIDWGFDGEPLVSAKDAAAPNFVDTEYFDL